MSFKARWTSEATEQFEKLQADAMAAISKRAQTKRSKSSQAEGLFKQVEKCVRLLVSDPKHPGLHTHEYSSIEHPFEEDGKVFEAYVQNKTPGAHRLFWCYGPARGDITIIAITPHP